MANGGVQAQQPKLASGLVGDRVLQTHHPPANAYSTATGHDDTSSAPQQSANQPIPQSLAIPIFSGYSEEPSSPIMQLSAISQSLDREHRRSSSAADQSSKRREDAQSPEKDPQTRKSNEDGENTITPAWTEMKTKAGKDRKRLPLACIACRRKKIRCSGEHPACKHCVRSRIPCVYKVTTRKAAPRTDYMAMLDKRLKRMEERVIKVIPKEQQSIVATTGRAVLKPGAPQSLRRASTITKKRAADQSVANLEAWARVDGLLPPTQQGSNMAAVEEDSGEKSLLQEGADKLPPKDVQEHLAEVYFDHVYGQSYHLLHKPSFMRRLALGRVAPVLLLAVCAISARFSNHPAVRTEPAFMRGEEWAAAARNISMKRYDSPNITILIVYLILTLHEFGTCQGGRSWMFGGMAQRMAYALQLHQDLTYDPQSLQRGRKVELSFTDREIRRRSMWACFLMDRFCSSGTDRPTFVKTEHLHAQLPVAERLFVREIEGHTEDISGSIAGSGSPDVDQISRARENMGVAAYTIRIIAVWGNAIAYYNLGGKQRDKYQAWDERSEFTVLRKQVKTWQDNLPDHLKYNNDNLATHASEKIANQFIFMHIILHQTILFINRFALPNPAARAQHTEQIPPTFMKECAKAAWTAANRVSSLVKDGMTHNVVAPFAGYAAFFSGAVHIQGAFSKNEALQASSKQHLTFNINYLTKMKKHWGMLHFMTENLRDLYRKLSDYARNSARTQETDAPEAPVDTGIFQYGDWFDRYPHGINANGFEDPPPTSDREPGADAGLGQQGDLHTVEDFFANLNEHDRPALPANKRKHKRQVSRTNSLDAGAAHMPASSSDPPLQRSESMPPSEELYLEQDMSHQDFTSDYQAALSAVANEAHDLGTVSYIDTQAVINSMTGYQAELAQLANTAVNPIMANMSLGFAAAGIPSMPDHQSPYDGHTSGAWFMPYNLEPPNITQAASSYGAPVEWSPQYAAIRAADVDLRSPLNLSGPQHSLGGGPGGTM